MEENISEYECVVSRDTVISVRTSYVLSKAGKSTRQSCVFSPTSADRLNEPHGSARAPFSVKRRRREPGNSLSNDESQNKAMAAELYWVGLRQTYFFRRLCKIAKSDYQRHDIRLSAYPSVRPSVLMSAWNNSVPN